MKGVQKTKKIYVHVYRLRKGENEKNKWENFKALVMA